MEDIWIGCRTCSLYGIVTRRFRGSHLQKTGVIQKICGGPRTGDHSPRCVLMVTGPNVVPGEIDSTISVEEIAPTLAEMMGIELSDADGVSFLSDISAK